MATSTIYAAVSNTSDTSVRTYHTRPKHPPNVVEKQTGEQNGTRLEGIDPQEGESIVTEGQAQQVGEEHRFTTRSRERV